MKGNKRKFKKNSSRPRMKIKQSTSWQEIQTFGKIPILTNTSRPDYNKVQAATGSARQLTTTFQVYSPRNRRQRRRPANGQVTTCRDLRYSQRRWQRLKSSGMWRHYQSIRRTIYNLQVTGLLKGTIPTLSDCHAVNNTLFRAVCKISLKCD